MNPAIIETICGALDPNQSAHLIDAAILLVGALAMYVTRGLESGEWRLRRVRRRKPTNPRQP